VALFKLMILTDRSTEYWSYIDSKILYGLCEGASVLMVKTGWIVTYYGELTIRFSQNMCDRGRNAITEARLEVELLT